MQDRHYSSLTTKLRALALVEDGQYSIREIAKDLQIPKSTLHDNLPIYRSDLERFTDSKQKYDYYLVRCDVCGASPLPAGGSAKLPKD